MVYTLDLSEVNGCVLVFLDLRIGFWSPRSTVMGLTGLFY